MATETVHVPGLGDVKKTYAYAGAVVLSVILGVAYWRHQQSVAANAANTSTSDTSGTAGTDPNAIDPSTGMTYAEEASGAYGSFPYGGVSDYGGSYYGSGNITGYDQYGNPIYSTGITGNNTYTTNSEWATAAENDLLAMNVDQATAAAAISKVLAGLPVTTAQQQLFEEALGLDGQPPQGYPKPIKLTDTPGQPGTTNTVKVPNVVGSNFGHAFNVLFTAGLDPKPGRDAAVATRIVTKQVPASGTTVKKGATVTLTLAPVIAVHKPGK